MASGRGWFALMSVGSVFLVGLAMPLFLITGGDILARISNLGPVAPYLVPLGVAASYLLGLLAQSIDSLLPPKVWVCLYGQYSEGSENKPTAIQRIRVWHHGSQTLHSVLDEVWDRVQLLKYMLLALPLAALTPVGWLLVNHRWGLFLGFTLVFCILWFLIRRGYHGLLLEYRHIMAAAVREFSETSS